MERDVFCYSVISWYPVNVSSVCVEHNRKIKNVTSRCSCFDLSLKCCTAVGKYSILRSIVKVRITLSETFIKILDSKEMSEVSVYNHSS